MVSNRPTRTLSAAVVTADRTFRDWIKESAAAGIGIELRIDIVSPFQAIDADHLRLLRQAGVEVVVLDLDDDPALGIRFAQFLADSHAGWRVIASASELAPDLLISAMQAGINEFIPRPLSRDALAAALVRLERKLGSGGDTGDREPAKVFAFHGAKGGNGTTAVATNVATYLHQLTGRKTLIVDLDFELGDVAGFLGVQPRFNLIDMVRNFHRMDAELLTSYIEQHPTGVHLLSAPFTPERSETVSPEQIKKIFAFLKQHYDYIVVDTSKTFSPVTLIAFEQADETYLVTTVDLPSLRNLKRSLPLVQRAAGENPEKVRLVVNRFHPNNAITVEEAERVIGRPAFWKLANDYEAVMESINAGAPLVTAGKSPFARDMRAMTTAIAGLTTPDSGNGNGRLGGLKRLLGMRKQQEVANHG